MLTSRRRDQHQTLMRAELADDVTRETTNARFRLLPSAISEGHYSPEPGIPQEAVGLTFIRLYPRARTNACVVAVTRTARAMERVLLSGCLTRSTMKNPAGVIARPLPAVLPRRACFFCGAVSAAARGSNADFDRVSAGVFRTIVVNANLQQISAL